MSADVDIGNELGKGCFIILAILIAVFGIVIYAWPHLHWS